MAPAGTGATSHPGKRGGAGLLLMMAVLGLLMGAAGVAFVTSRTAPPASGDPAGDLSGEVVHVTVDPASLPAETAGPPKWSRPKRSGRGRDALLAYDLPAENTVSLWGKSVRPVLTVRCDAGETEVFVLTESAAALENTEGTHTVRIGFDGTPYQEEKWLASADYDALFAADAVDAAKRIAAAQGMRFGFTPYNSSPVVARFEVRGFERLIGTIAQACRWK